MAWTLLPRSAPMTPEHWLEIATHKLAPEAATRIRAEHLAHLEDALRAGETAEAALREWGDPHAANDAYCKAHLTVRDAELLHPGYALSAAGWRRAVFEEGEWGRSGMAIVLPLMFTLLRGFFTPSVAVLSLLAVAFAVPTLRWLLVAGLRLGGVSRVLAAWLLSGWSSLVMLLGLTLWQMPEKWGDALGLGLLGVFGVLWLWRLWLGLRIFRKAGHQTP
ncbi:hypothetical protein SAMN04488058_12915 [Deinococcus reticulitermitis]|uniref:Uncharacterized protein n=1 Tax=Deinococcus reticulitermitis TaxID=856736 RepID=A0A1H7CG83_9DEIO|nr:hypothetical protein [Deinococcus reticulitermitis]SEJ88793.1 hypothetical protein SAMN04488058_12915 [Deinococcus reticulitermitis]